MPFDFDLENIKDSLDRINLESLLPDLSNFEASVLTFTRWAMLLGPLVILALGVFYFLAAPKEANYTTGYRCFFGMGSVQAWRFTQRVAGILFGALGLILTVVMLFVSGGFAGMAVMDMVWKAVTCLIWEAVLVILATLAVNFTAFRVFDRNGEIRPGKKK